MENSKESTDHPGTAFSKTCLMTHEELPLLAQAIRKVVGAITQFHAADCVTTTLVATKVLRHLGHDAQSMAGSAAWRVGPGSGDVISHAYEMHQHANGFYQPSGPGVYAGMFHSWVEVGECVVDFTTATLPEKARTLDKMDGGCTRVLWAPDHLWVPRARSRKFCDVANGYDVGLFAYVPHERIMNHVFRRVVHDDVTPHALVVLEAFKRLKAGERVDVIGVGEGDPQTLGSAILQARDRGFAPADGLWSVS